MVPLKKALRTWQTHFPALIDAKFAAMDGVSRFLRRPFDRDFTILRALTPTPDECLIDVGANRGQSISACRMFLPRTHLVSFEPNRILFDRLHARFGRDPNLTLHNFGLADEDFDAPLYVPRYRNWVFDGLASFDLKSASEWLSPKTILNFKPDLVTVEKLTCKVRRLDDFNLNPAFIKIDVQGLEEKVVRGGLETVKRSQPVLLVEDAGALVPLLSPLGYAEYTFDGSRLARSRNRTTNSIFLTQKGASRLSLGGLVVDS